MTDPTLFVPASKVATWLGLDAVELTNIQTEIITDAILDAQSKVSAYLLRSLEPQTVTLTELVRDDLWESTDIRAWPEARALLDETYRVSTAVANTTDSTVWDVTFVVGLDVANDPELDPIRRFIRQDAIATLTDSPALASVKRRVKSVSAEGQSVSYEAKAASPDAAGGNLTVTSLRRWRRYAVGRATDSTDRRPYPYRA